MRAVASEAMSASEGGSFPTFLEVVEIEIRVHVTAHKPVTAYPHLLGGEELVIDTLPVPFDSAGEHPVPLSLLVPVPPQIPNPVSARVPALRPALQNVVYVIVECLERAVRDHIAVVIAPAPDH